MISSMEVLEEENKIDDLEKSIQNSLKDKKFAYIHNSLLDMGYIPGEFPSELIYKLGNEFNNQKTT